MKNKRTVIIALVMGFIAFIGIAIMTNLFNSNDLPVQISGALLEAVVTALITYFLLAGQSQSEEIKERNVKVFEKKSELFNNFIEKLWEIWEDRSVTLEEISELIKLVSKDIIPYAKPESSETILKYLNKIADLANSEKSENTNQEIQNSVFAIINTLSKEIGLGGEIKPEINNQLNLLENKVLPVLNRRNYINQIKELVKKKSIGALSEYEEDEDNVLWWKIGENSGIWIRVGDVRKEGVIYITFWSEFYGNREYQPYRFAQKGEWKDWLKNEYKGNELLNFNDLRTGRSISNDKLDELADKVVKFYSDTKIDGKTIEVIIEEVKQ